MKKTAEPLGSPSDSENQEKYGAGLVKADSMVAKLSGSKGNWPLQEVRLG